MKENTEQGDVSKKIKVFSSDDDKLKILGELLSNKSSRDIIKLLIDKEMYTNEIAKKLELRVSLVIHHLQKMESIGLVEITNKKITEKGEEHRFFRIPNGMLIAPNESYEIKENGFLKKIFRDGIKFAVIGISAFIASWIFPSDAHLQGSTAVEPIIPTASIPYLIIIIGLLVMWIEKKKRMV
ncbi:winged helix-turn-helix domain-containing protein [Nitrosopumilus sp. Nsub]|uniref:ArsR/SmtB family transcription factor n=1 Tax=Nitrosopumilus sp. Nsub TaxID=1776294 RepID=UPI000834261D|nr:winged helix-turn-helix domain-containing protein [Nitrosopumilus sp. Nsub]